MNPENEHFIKEIIRNYKSLGVSVEAKWDAGGDSRFCMIEVKGNRDYNDNILQLDPYEFLIEEDEKGNILRQDIYIHNEFINKLSDYVIATLGLPEVGEIHHNGEGIIDINEDNQVFIRFSAEYGYYDYDSDGYSYYDEKTGEWQEIEEKLENIIYSEEIEDIFGLRKLLHKATIEFSGRINREGEMETSVQIEVFQGDEIQISAEQSAFYEEIIKKQLLKGLEEMKKEEEKLKKAAKHTLFASIDLTAHLTAEPKVVFTLSPSANHFENFVEEVVILIE